jgi:hypothetical protein
MMVFVKLRMSEGLDRPASVRNLMLLVRSNIFFQMNRLGALHYFLLVLGTIRLFSTRGREPEMP